MEAVGKVSPRAGEELEDGALDFGSSYLIPECDGARNITRNISVSPTALDTFFP